MANFKKEIDKDLMYKKLMPSNFKPAKFGAARPADTESVPVGAEESAAPDFTKITPAKPARRTVKVPVIDSQKTELINVMEMLVIEKLDSVMARFNCCKCDRCKKDILALALNKLPPQYTVLKEGELVPDVDKQLNAQILTSTIQAVLQVRANPRH